jgi:drug/metabolite transporter (DMT)-like permease
VTATTYTTDDDSPAIRTDAYLAIVVALIAASFAAVTIRLAQLNGIPSPLIPAFRLSVAALVITPLVWSRYRADIRALHRREVVWSAIGGFWIATHFTLLAFSLENTTVLVSQVIVNTGPLWVALLETVFLRERLPRIIYGALMITLLGGGVIAFASANPAGLGASHLLALSGDFAGFAPSSAQDPLLGAVLALAGSIAGSIYLTIGRKVRAGISIVPYVWLVFGLGGIFGLGIVAMTGTWMTGHPTEGYLWLLVLTLVPQLIGHSGFNYALGYFPATVVSITTQAVTISAAIIAFILFAEVPTMLELLGSVVIAVGVLIAILAQRR